MQQELKHICIVRLSALGDIANCIPALRAIQARYPHATISWVIGKQEYALVRDIAKVRWVVVDKKRLWHAWWTLRKLPAFDVLLHMQASLRASFLTTALKARTTIGLDKARSKDFQHLFCNQRIAPRAQAHTLETYLDFAAAIDADTSIIQWNLPIQPMHTEAQDFDLPIPYVVISPCASKAIRNWSKQGYVEVIRHIAQRHQIRCVLTGGNSQAEHDYAAYICQQLPEVVNMIGRTSVRQMTSILSDALCVVAPDSGPAHIATAVNTPVIGLYANTNPQRARPYASAQWLVNQYPQAVRHYLGKEPEAIAFGTRVRHPKVMSLITADMVIAQLDALLPTRL